MVSAPSRCGFGVAAPAVQTGCAGVPLASAFLVAISGLGLHANLFLSAPARTVRAGPAPDSEGRLLDVNDCLRSPAMGHGLLVEAYRGPDRLGEVLWIRDFEAYDPGSVSTAAVAGVVYERIALAARDRAAVATRAPYRLVRGGFRE